MQSSSRRKHANEMLDIPDGGFDVGSASVAQVQARGLHVGIIMDGNGRWALRKGLARHCGHKAGVETLKRIVEAAPEHGISTITAYAFSVDNWSRPSSEVNLLMGLLGQYLSTQVDRLVENGVRLSVIGRRDRLPGGVSEAIETCERATRGCSKLHLRLAIDYSSRDAILRAACAAVQQLGGELGGAAVSRDALAHFLNGDAFGGDVDLLIRTGGEKRLSDFLLWECAYAELYFTDRLWPDFGAENLSAAVAEFHGRERRFGGLGVGVAAE